MGKRKNLSKKIRFEVFKRDKFTCQYCGRSVPEVILHVDHIVPVSKGGKNDILNLITSCQECNLGKGARELSDDSIVKKQQRQIQEMAERNEQLEMMLEWRNSLDVLCDREVDAVNDRISSISDWKANDNGKKKLKKMIKEFSIQLVLDAVDIAFDKYYDGSEESWCYAFNKIGGICFNKTRSDKKDVYYFNVLRKMCFNEFGYVNPAILSTIIREHIQVDDDFNEVARLVRESYSWSDFVQRVRREFEYE